MTLPIRFEGFSRYPRAVLWIAVGLLAGCAGPSQFRRDVNQRRNAAAARQPVFEANRDGMPGVTAPLTLQDAERIALKNNRSLQAVRRELEIAEGRALQARTVAWPHVTATANYTRLDDPPRMALGAQTVPVGFEDNWTLQLGVRQPIFHGGAIPAALRTATLQTLRSEERVRETAQAVLFQTRQRYYDALLAQTLLDVTAESLRLAEILLQDAQRKRAMGVATEYDVLRAEVEVSNARVEWLQQKNRWDAAMTHLCRTLGVSPLQEIQLADEFRYEPRTVELDAAFRAALQQRPEILSAEYALQIQQEALRMARSAYWPQLDAFFVQRWANPDPHQATRDEWADAWSAGLSLNYPLFDGWARAGNILQERARWEQARTRLAEVEETVIAEVRQAVLNLRHAAAWVDATRLNLQRAEEGFRLVLGGYRQGTKTQLDVLDAQTALTRTQALFHQALHAHALASAQLDLVTGIIGEPADRMPAPVPEAPENRIEPKNEALR